MNNLTNNDLHLALTNLLTHRVQALRKLTMGAVYEDALRAQLGRLSALAGVAQVQGAELAVALKETDTRHDALGGGIASLLDAIERSPLTGEADRAAAARVRAAFVPSRSELLGSYVDEAARARQRKVLLVDYGADLGRIPVPGGTLADWAAAFIDAGEQLHDLLQQRARLAEARSAEPAGPHAGAVRSETIGLLGRMRSALADDVAWAGRDARLDEAIFGFVDMLQAMRSRRATGRDGSGEPGEADTPEGPAPQS